MNLNVNSEFLIILIVIIVLVFIVVLGTILYESALPMNLSNITTGFLSILFILLIGFSFMFIPDANSKKQGNTNSKNNTDRKKFIKMDNKFLVYLFLLIVLTVFNFYT
jgi:hypothetical protein